VSEAWGWGSLALLGAYHGLNPAMGWLFAVALGMQRRTGRAVLAALPPIALGHAASIALVVAVLALGFASVPDEPLRWLVAAALGGFGAWKLVRPRHPRWVGMQVGFADLALWSFLMATAHGAGLMLLPIFLNASDRDAHHHGPWLATWPAWAAAVAVHTLAMLAVSAVVALVVYYKVGVAILRTAWLDLDRVWAVALVVAGLAALL
jgi:hypothetical protein